MEEGEISPPAGISWRTARIRRMLMDLADRKLWSLFIVFDLEKTLEDVDRIRYTRAWTRAKMLTFISIPSKLPSINDIKSHTRIIYCTVDFVIVVLVLKWIDELEI